MLDKINFMIEALLNDIAIDVNNFIRPAAAVASAAASASGASPPECICNCPMIPASGIVNATNATAGGM